MIPELFHSWSWSSLKPILTAFAGVVHPSAKSKHIDSDVGKSFFLKDSEVGLLKSYFDAKEGRLEPPMMRAAKRDKVMALG